MYNKSNIMRNAWNIKKNRWRIYERGSQVCMGT